jgi:hypothetical protein
MTIKNRKIEEDCISLLERVLECDSPNKDYIETYIAFTNTERFYNVWLDSMIFGYQNPETPRYLRHEGIFKEMKEIKNVVGKVDNRKLEDILYKALTNTEELINSDLYEGRVVEESPVVVNVPGLPKRKPEGLRGLYKIKVSRFIVKKWLNKNALQKTTALKNTPPSGWKLVEENNTARIKKNGSIVFTFPNNWSRNYKYFKCLWEDYGIKKSYKEVYEFESNLTYPTKNVWRVNRNMRNTINKLRKEFKLKNVPIYIETNKGFTLTIS